jgi:hypothetical protein
MIAFRHADASVPFLWEDASQPAARWHAEGEGPAHYLAETPDAAWAEFLRHEEIREEADLAGIERTIWAVEIPDDERFARPRLDRETLVGDLDSYAACQTEAARLRAAGSGGLRAPSAAMRSAAQSGWRVNGGLVPGRPRAEQSLVLFGRRPDLVGWVVADAGRPRADLLERVRYFDSKG